MVSEMYLHRKQNITALKKPPLNNEAALSIHKSIKNK